MVLVQRGFFVILRKPPKIQTGFCSRFALVITSVGRLSVLPSLGTYALNATAPTEVDGF